MLLHTVAVWGRGGPVLSLRDPCLDDFRGDVELGEETLPISVVDDFGDQLDRRAHKHSPELSLSSASPKRLLRWHTSGEVLGHGVDPVTKPRRCHRVPPFGMPVREVLPGEVIRVVHPQAAAATAGFKAARLRRGLHLRPNSGGLLSERCPGCECWWINCRPLSREAVDVL